MQLEGEPDAAAQRRGRDAGDVAVQLQRRAGGAEEPDAGADQAAVVVRAGDVVAGLGQGPQQRRRHRRVLGVGPPDAVVEPVDLLQAVQVGDLPDPYAGRQRRRVGRVARVGGHVRVPGRAGTDQLGHDVHARQRFGVRHGRSAPEVAADLVAGTDASCATSAAIRATRPGSSATSTCSSSAWAPPPTAPSPSNVGVPTPAVKLPSDPPPTATPVNEGRPSWTDERPGPLEQVGRRGQRQRRAVRSAGHLQRGPGQQRTQAVHQRRRPGAARPRRGRGRPQ